MLGIYLIIYIITEYIMLISPHFAIGDFMITDMNTEKLLWEKSNLIDLEWFPFSCFTQNSLPNKWLTTDEFIHQCEQIWDHTEVLD